MMTETPFINIPITDSMDKRDIPFIEVNNLIASLGIHEVSNEDILAINQKYQTDILRVFTRNVVEYISSYVHFAILTDIPHEQYTLNCLHLSEIFGLGKSEAHLIQKDVEVQNYIHLFNELIQTKRLVTDDKTRLSDLQNKLNLSDDDVFAATKSIKQGLIDEKLKEILADKRVTDEEEESLKQFLKDIDAEDEQFVIYSAKYSSARGKFQLETGHNKYMQLFSACMNNGHISDENEAEMNCIIVEYGLDKHQIEIETSRIKRNCVVQKIEEILYDRRVSDYEYEQLNNLINNIKASPDLITDKYANSINYAHRLWMVENLPLKTVDCDINLQKNEKCYYICNYANWSEPRKVRGVESLTYIDTGKLYLTSKRIMVVTQSKVYKVDFSKVLSTVYNRYKPAVTFRKSSGKDPTIDIKGDFEQFSIILERIRKQNF